MPRNNKKDTASISPAQNKVIAAKRLPADHLCRLVLCDDFVGESHLVDWTRISRRLATHPSEAQQWMSHMWCSGGQPFLHVLCSRRFGDYHDFSGPDGGEEQHLLRVLRESIDAYPQALLVADSNGLYPAHYLARKFSFRGLWEGDEEPSGLSKALYRAFRLVLDAAPQVATKISAEDGDTLLHLFLSHRIGDERDQLQGVIDLLDIYPQALGIKNKRGECPLFIVCSYLPQNILVVKKLLKRFPGAVEITNKEGRTPLLENLFITTSSERDYDAARIILESCPWSAAFEHQDILMAYSSQQCLFPVGDALDYISVKYASLRNETGWDFGSAPWEDEPSENHFYEYVDVSIEFILNIHDAAPSQETAAQDQAEYVFKMFLTILRTMSGNRTNFQPLHAATQGRLCRPWHLIVMQELVRRFGDDELHIPDADGNLPLHLFLESCMAERDRAIQREYVHEHVNSYQNDVVGHCFRLIFDANPSAASVVNEDGRLPLHLAIENCPSSTTADDLIRTNRPTSTHTYSAIFDPLVQEYPRALVTMDPISGLYPFAAAAANSISDLTLVYRLLRSDPTVLSRATT